MKKFNSTLLAFVLIFVTTNLNYAVKNDGKTSSKDFKSIRTLLDDYHKAASEADGKRYFSLMAEDSRFLGTDAEERWTKKEFEAYANPYFSKGRGWTYIPKERVIKFSQDKTVAWFDERLYNDHYGELRGSGVLEKFNGKWKITHYNMVFVIPNSVARKVVEMINKDKLKKDKTIK